MTLHDNTRLDQVYSSKACAVMLSHVLLLLPQAPIAALLLLLLFCSSLFG